MESDNRFARARELFTGNPRRDAAAIGRLAVLKPARMERVYAARDKSMEIFDVFEDFFYLPESSEQGDCLDIDTQTFKVSPDCLWGDDSRDALAEELIKQDASEDIDLGTVNGVRSSFVVSASEWHGLKVEGVDEIIIGHAPYFKTAFLNANYLPLGEYGEQFTRGLCLALGVIATQLAENQPKFSNVDQAHAKSMVRSKDNHPDDSVCALTLWEGAVTVAQSINLLMQYKLPEFDDPVSLAGALVDGGALLKFAHAVPVSGIIGPLSVTGRRIQHPLHVAPQDNSLRLDSGMLEAFSKHMAEAQLDRRLVYEKVIKKNASFTHRNLDTVLNGAGCPATYSKRAENSTTWNVVQQMSQHFMSVLERVAAQLVRLASASKS